MQSLQPPNVRETLRRCAVAHSFDRPLYDTVLAHGVEDAPPFDELVREREIVPAGADRYAVRDRVSALQGWTDLAAIEELRKAIAAHSASTCVDEQLYQTLTCDPASGRQLFADAFAAAEQKFQLARCNELVSLALERWDMLDPETRAAIDGHRAILRARSFWKNDYYKSLVYLSRPTVEPYFDTLLAEEQPRWIGSLYAMGGRGKTAAIRWLIARTCVPRRIPVAKIDFDFPPDSAPRPAAFLLEIVRQLDEQLPGTVYFELKKELGEYAASVSGPAAFNDSYLLQLTNRFASALREVRGAKPTLLIFDTVEEAMIGGGGELLRGIMELFRGAHAEAPAIRLLFSGRYSFWEKDRVQGVESFRDEMLEEKEIAPFDDEEAKRYLLERRKLPDSKAIPAIVASSEGNPFKLSLYADIVKDEPDADIDELIAGGSVELTYLIRRVVRRLPDPRLQWVLRYGVVPRRLTIGFLKAVAPYLLDAMLGPNAFDEPLKNLPPALRENVFAQGILTKEQSLAVDQLWTSLTRYAASHSWVTSERGDLLRFHPEVLDPMRELLRDNPIYHTLHERAAEYYDQIGDARESVYHRFQIGMASAAQYWRDAVDRASQAEQPEELLALAREVPAGHALRAEAERREAQALLHLARLRGPSDPAWDAAKRAGERIDDPAVKAAVALSSGAAAEALLLLEKARPEKDADHLNVALLRGAAHASLGAFEPASVAYDEARAFAAFVPFLPEWPRRSIERLTSFTLAEQHVSAGRYGEAFTILRRARKDEDEQFGSEAALRLARLQLQLRMPGLALQTLTRASESDVRRAILEAEAELLRFDPIRALELLPNPEGDFVNLARTAQLRFRILVQMREIDGARRACEQALSLWREAAQRDRRPEVRFGLTECLVEAAYAEVDEFGDLARARDMLGQLERASTPEDHNARFHAIALDTLTSTGRGFLRIVEEARTPALRIAAAIVGLRRGLGLRPELDLEEALAAVTPPQARLPMLHALRYATEVDDPVEDDDHRYIMAFLPDPRSADDWTWVPKDDRATLALALADAHRIFGQMNEARSLLAWAEKRFEHGTRPLFDRVRMKARRDVGIQRGPHQRVIDRWRATLKDHPDFLATLLIEAAVTIGAGSRASRLAEEAAETAGSAAVKALIEADAVSLGVRDKFAAPQASVSRVREATLRIETADEVRTETPNGKSFRRDWPPLPNDPDHAQGVVPYAAIKELLEQTDQALTGLRDRLFDPFFLMEIPQIGPCHLRLELSRARQAYPWELAVPEDAGRAFPSVYRAIPRMAPRGESGPLPRDPRILVIRRSMRIEQAVQRGSFLPIESVYPDAQVLEDPTVDDIHEVIQSGPDLIHISSSLSESASVGGVFLEFASRALEMVSNVPQSLSPRLLASAAASLKKQPIVVLDATLPRGPTEFVRQLFLRNVFAAELFATGAFQSVVATGLFEHPGGWEEFSRAIYEGRRMGDLVWVLRRQQMGSTLLARIATRGIAFFSHSPDVTE